MFSVSAIPLAQDAVAEFRAAEGLPIYSSRSDGELIGRTEDSLRFQEFNRGLPGAPTRLTSGGVTGWVRLPQLRANGRATEFAEMVGGIVQVLRGDWDGAARNLENVIKNPATRAPLRLHALLLLGMARERDGGSGRDFFERALEQAPSDHRVVRYAATDDDETGVVIPKGTELLVRDVAAGHGLGNPIASLWLALCRSLASTRARTSRCQTWAGLPAVGHPGGPAGKAALPRDIIQRAEPDQRRPARSAGRDDVRMIGTR